MRIDIVTIFPRLFDPFLDVSLVGRAIERGLLEVSVHDLRDFTSDRHRTVDDQPYGGGGGMVMTAPPWIRAAREISGEEDYWRIMMSPQGKRLDEFKVRQLAERDRLLLFCGRYEAVDERVETVIDEEISIGDYVLSGGEIPAMVVVETISRQIPGVVGLAESVRMDSFRERLLDFPHYTRPPVVEGEGVPEVLLSGDHEAIRRWRRRQALLATLRKRPDLLHDASLSRSEREFLRDAAAEEGISQLRFDDSGPDSDSGQG